VGAHAPSRRWGQLFEHRGVLIQQRYLCDRGECAPAAEDLRRLCGPKGLGCLLEAKAHVVFGRLSARVHVHACHVCFTCVADAFGHQS